MPDQNSVLQPRTLFGRILRAFRKEAPKSVVRKDGVDVLMLRARARCVALVLAKHAILFPLVFLPPMLVAASEGVWRLGGALAVPVAAGFAVWAAVRRRPLPQDLRQVEAVVVLALLFLLAPVLSVPAFMHLGMPWLDALFEGMSAITTTGLSVARNPDDWPYAAHFLRCWMQWCGGLAMATAVLAMLIGPGASALRLGKAGLDEGDRLASTRSRARQLLGAYAALTVFFWLAISLSMGSFTQGLLLALSAVSTGGYAALSDSLTSHSPLTQSLVIAASVAGCVSLLAVALACRMKWRDAWKLGSLQRVTIWLLLCVLTLILIRAATGTGDTFRTTLNLLSAISTAGFSVGAMPQEPLFLLMFCIVMVIGGDVGSTAGGIKLARLTMLLRIGRHATREPRLPDNAVAPLRQYGEVVKARQIIALSALLFFYVTVMLALWSGLVAYGYSPLPALFDTISALSTVGLSTGVISADLPDPLKAATVMAMWLGRLEFVAVLLIFLPRTWINPNKGL